MATDDMYGPPVNRAMRALDRSFFQKRIPVSAARVHDRRDIGPCRKALETSREMLRLDRLPTIRPDPVLDMAREGRKCVLLRPEVRHDNATTWSHTLHDLVSTSRIGVIPYELHLDYDYWTYHDIMSAILPPELHGDIASGFSTIGHIAHLNLREPMWPYKHLLARVLLDKNPHIRVVVNKTANVGRSRAAPSFHKDAETTTMATASASTLPAPPPNDPADANETAEDDPDSNPYRTFPHEILASTTPTPTLLTTASESGCAFTFDFAAVYWNPRLSTEHARILSLLRPGAALCDACAGVGPFVVPAARHRRVYAWANDLNPAAAAACREAVARNGVGRWVREVGCGDGGAFIRGAAGRLWGYEWAAEVREAREEREKAARRRRGRGAGSAAAASAPAQTQEEDGEQHEVQDGEEEATRPRTFSHILLNLPAAAIPRLLPSLVGLYAQPAFAHAPRAALRPLPLVHAYCFALKGDLREAAEGAAREVSAAVGAEVRVRWSPDETEAEGSEDDRVERRVGEGEGALDWLGDGEAYVHDVRDVAPKKRMLCVSFRLPEAVAFRGRDD